jgi:hypothetical protein
MRSAGAVAQLIAAGLGDRRALTGGSQLVSRPSRKGGCSDQRLQQRETPGRWPWHERYPKLQQQWDGDGALCAKARSVR